MSTKTPSLDRTWGRRGFWMVLGSVFGIHLVFLFIFGRPVANVPDVVLSKTSFRMLAGKLESGALDSLLVSDPTLFVLPGRGSFSGAAWMDVKEMDYAPAEWSEPPRLLKLRAETLAGTFQNFVQANRKPLMQVSEKAVPFEPSPSLTAGSNFRSEMKIDAELSERFAAGGAELNAWQSAEPLDRSVVQVGVNEAGQVVAMRLINRSGLAAADQAAVSAAGKLQFMPVSTPGLVWGRIVFHWQTEPLPVTNAVPLILEAR